MLPLVDDLNVLPAVVANKKTLLSLAPLIIEPAPTLIPIIVSVLKTSPTSFSVPGFVLLATGAYEVVKDSAFIGGAEVLLGLPLLVLGTLLGSIESLPSKATFRSSSSSSSSSFSSSSKTDKVVSSTARVSSSRQGGQENGKRKVIKIQKKLKL